MTDDLLSVVNTPKPSNYKWGCGVILQDPNTKKILMAKRTDNNKLSTVGGTVEHQESPLQAICRETKEESNVTINNLKYYGCDTHSSPNGDWTTFLFYSDDFDASNIQNQVEEMGEYSWYDPNEIDLDDPELFEPCRLALEQAYSNGLLVDKADNSIPYVQCPSTATSASSAVHCAYSYQEPEKVFVDNQGFYWD